MQGSSPASATASPYTRAADSLPIASPSPSADPKAAHRPTALYPRANAPKDSSMGSQGPATPQPRQQTPQQPPHLPLHSPQAMKPPLSPLRPMTPAAAATLDTSGATKHAPKIQANTSPRQPARSGSLSTPNSGGAQQGHAPGLGSGSGPGSGSGGASPGTAPLRTVSPSTSPSSPRPPLPPTASGAMPTGASNSTPPLNSSGPKRNNPPTLPPARAHGIHARSLARPPSTLLSASPASSSMASPSTPDSARSTHSTPKSAKASVGAPLPPGSRESTFPAPILQAPQQSHQPRQRPVPSARSPVESTFQPRPAPPPVRSSSGLSGSVPLQQPVPTTSDQPPSAVAVGSKKDTSRDLNPTEKKGSYSNSPEPEPNDDDCDEDDAIKSIDEAAKRTTTRQRKVRKSLEKLTRSSIEKRRRPRQMKALTSIPPSTSSTMTPLKANTLTEAPKRLSLWASLFGNGSKAEARPAVSDSLDSVAGSQLKTDSDARQASSSAIVDSSARSEKAPSDTSTHSSRSSESLEQDDDQSQFSPGESIADSSSINSAPSVADVSVARHERTRTLPGMLPQWDGSLLWSLTKALGAKKTEAPPLDSDSSDSDGSEVTPVVEDGDEHAGESEDAASTKSSSSLDEHSATDAGTEETEEQQRSPIAPAREPLSIRTHIPEQRVVVAEAQVQIGDDESGDDDEDEDPFTDSHALPASASPSVVSSTLSKGQLSAVSASPVSSTSPSLSPLSYLTGSAASGSTWSLQGSRQSLMKMIFKSKNEPATSPAAETSNPSDLVDPYQYKAESPVGSASPSTPSQAPHMDLFADFESTSLSTSLDIQTKETKRRSFLLPGAFPGQGETARDEVQESSSGSGYEQTHVPMYAASEGDSLAFAQDDTQPGEQEGSDEFDDGDQDDSDSDSSDYEQDMISTLPFKNSYERSSFLQEPPLPRFNPAAALSPGRQQRAFPQHLPTPVSSHAPSHDASVEQEPLQIAVHTVTPQPPPSKPTPQSTLKDKLDTSKSLLRGKSSPSNISSNRVSTPGSGVPPDDKSLVASLKPPLRATSGSSSRTNKQPADTSKTHIIPRSETKAPSLEDDIDYCRYKEEVTESTAPQRFPIQGQAGHPHDDDTTATSSEETESSEQTNGDSPLVVEVISSGLRSAGSDSSASALSTFGSGSRRGSAPNVNHVPVHAPQLHQPQGKMGNPPPLPPPRNSRRPRSKTLSRYGSKDNIRVSLEQLSRPSFIGYTVSNMKAVSRYESPTKEHIMEEMGSEQARAFSEEDYVYCQNDKMREVIRTNSLMSQGNQTSLSHQGYGQPYSKGNSAFDEYSSSTSDYQQPPTTMSQQASQQHTQAPVADANDALLVATLRDQIASLSSERDQFYQETLILRQKHEMLTSLVSNMGVAVESIQQQQLLQQHQQQHQQQQHQQHHHQQQQQYHAQPSLESGIMGSLSSMSLPVMAGSDSLLNNYQPQRGQSEYVLPDHQQPQHVPRRHHEDQAAQYIDQAGQGEDGTAHPPYGFAAHPQQNACVDPYPIQPQQEEPQLQPRRNHFHDADLQRSERIRQLSDEYSIQMPRNSEESLRGFHQHSQPDLIQDLSLGHGQGFQGHVIAQDPSQMTSASQGPYDAEAFQDVYDGQHLHDSFVQQQQQQQHQQQQLLQHQLPQQPASFGEGYDLIPSEEFVDNNTAVMNEGAHASEYFQLQQHQQSLDEIQQQGGLTLQQLKHQHQQNRSEGHQYRRSTDTRHSSQTSQDGYQLMDVITTRPMSGGMASTGVGHGSMDFGYGGGQQPQRQELDFGPTNPFSSNYNPALQALPTREQTQHMGHLRLQQDQADAPGSHLRRHHSMQYPQSASRQFSASEIIHPDHQQSSQYQQQQQQQPSSQYPSQASDQRAGHGRPPVWEPSRHHQSRSSSSSRIDHRRQRSNPQQDAPFPSQPDKGMLLLLSSSTSFMNAHEYHGESPCLGSAGLHGAAGSSTAPLSMFSNVVQQEKVRIEERTSTLNGAAGWSERPFSPVIASSSEAAVAGEDAGGSSSRHLASFAEIMADAGAGAGAGASTTLLTGAAKTRVLTKDTTDKIRQQFDSYLADPKRRSRHLESERELGERDQREERIRQDLETDPIADATSDSGSESDDERDESAVEEEHEERVRQTGSQLLGRSKTVASTGISTRMNRISGQDPSQQQPQHQAQQQRSGSGMSGQQQHKGVQAAKETLIRHHSSSGSLRSVARHHEQSRTETKDVQRAKDVTEDHGQLLSGGKGGGGSSSSSHTSSGADVHVGGTPSQGLPQQPQKAQQQQQQPHQHLSRQNVPGPATTMSRPAVAYKVPVDSPRLPSFPPAASSSSKTVIDEEGGDWGLQAQPRRYNSVKLGMTGVTGATRRAIGRPVEKGHGLELGPEDCV